MKNLILSICFISGSAFALEPNELVKRNEASQGLVLHCQIVHGDTLTALKFIPRSEYVEFSTNRDEVLGAYLTQLRKLSNTYAFNASGEFRLDGDLMTFTMKTRNSLVGSCDARGELTVKNQYGTASYPLVCNARQ